MNFKIQYKNLYWLGYPKNGLPYNCQKPKIKKLTILLTLLMSGHMFASALTQDITLQLNNVPLESAFSEIKKQSGRKLLYNTKLLTQAQHVSVDIKNASLEDAMQRVLLSQPFSYSIENGVILIIPKKQQTPDKIISDQNFDVQGRVLNSAGTAIAAVTVAEKGTRNKTSTNASGEFALKVSASNSVLVFSSVGYIAKEITVADLGKTIILEDDISTLEEVVVVGYGKQKKTLLTSAISTVDRKTIEQTPGASLQNLLTGKVTGFFTQQRSGRPGGDGAEMSIRGVATYNGGTSPLILVDDIEYNSGQFAMIDVNEIATVSILKDAEATAIYGVKGANGVILVTTRRGLPGKTTINLRSQFGVQIPVKTMETLDSYNAVRLLNEASVNDGLKPVYTDEEVEKFRTGEDPYAYPNVDWYNTIYRKLAPSNEHNLDISGGSSRVKYFVSMGALNQGGLLNEIDYRGPEPEPNTSKVNNNYYFKRYKFRSNLDFKANESLTLKLDLTGTYAETNQPSPNIGFQLFQYEYVKPFGYPVYNPNGSFGYANPNLFAPRDGFNNVAALMSLGGYSREFNNFMNAMFSADQKLDKVLSGLSVKGMVTYSYANTASRSMTRSGIPAYYYNSIDSSYTPRDINLYRVAPYSLSYGGGTPNNRLNIQAHVNYSNSFGNAHNVSGLVLFNQTSYVEGAAIPFNFRGYTYRFGYNYKERYVLSASGAYNGSDRFISQKRYSLFPAFALAWNVDKESFSLPSFINRLKIRGSYGKVGNDNIGNNNIYFYEETYTRDGSYAFGESPTPIAGIYEGTQGNDNVSWETETKTNVGVDLGMFQNKLSITADYFYNHRYDILTRRQTIPLSFGVQTGTLPMVNLGEVDNRGVELEISYQDKIGQVGYNVKGLLSVAKNKLIFRDDPPALYPWQDRTGMPIGIAKQYIWEGGFYSAEELADESVAKPTGTVKQGFLKYKDMNGDGVINIDDMAYVGNPNLPNTVASLTLGINYKGFSISGLLQSNLGADAQLGFDMAVPFKAALQPIHQNRWTPETAQTATFPALTTNFAGTYMNPNGNLSTFWSTNANYLRLRSLEFAYTLPQAFSARLGLNSTRFFANGYNLITWSGFFKKYQYDPEVAANINTYTYPVTRIINVGMNINF